MRVILFGLISTLCFAGCSKEAAEPAKEVLGAKAPTPGPPPPPVVATQKLPYPRGGRVEIVNTDQGSKLTERVEAITPSGRPTTPSAPSATTPSCPTQPAASAATSAPT